MLLAAIRAIAIVGLFAALAEAQTDDETALTPTGGLYAYVKKKGAVIRFYRSIDSGSKTGQMTIKFSEIREVDAGGNDVTGKHSFKNFNNQDFNVSAQSVATLPNAVGVTAKVITLMTTLPDVNAQLKLQVFVIQTGGNLTLGDETSTVYSGQLKFTVEVDGWNWSNGGASIDFEVNIQIPPGRLVKAENDSSTGNHPRRFSFGAGATANFSTKVQVDNGTWQDMAPGYPKFTQNGANNIFTLRLPKFTTSVRYDPSFDPGADTSGTSKGSCTIQTSFTLGILCCLVFMLRQVL